MARRRAVAAVPKPSTGRAAPPPLDILRCPWTQWDSSDRSPERFESWLRERQRWRQSHDAPLPGLYGRDRLELRHYRERGLLNRDVVAAELSAVTR